MFALESAAAAAATAILAKLGVEGVPSNLATAVRTAIVLVFVRGLVVVEASSTRWRT
jgi:bacterial/archaeal transporter family protein